MKGYDDNPLPLFELDVRQRVRSWNNACAALTGLAEADAIGTTRHRSFFAGQNALTLADALLRSAPGGNPETLIKNDLTPHSLVDGWWLQKNALASFRGTRHTVQYLASLIHNAEGRPAGARQMVLTAAASPVLPDEDGGELLADSYRILAENIADGFLLNQDDYLILVNQAFARLLGYERPEDLMGRHITDFIAASHKKAFLTKHYNALEGKPSARDTWPHLRKDGKIVWLKGHPKRIIWKGKEAILSTLLDVTESYQAQKRMEKETEQLRREIDLLKSSLTKSYRFQKLVGKSPAMQEVYDLLLRAAAEKATVIIYGESGTGKELAAQAIHDLGQRSAGPFVPVNCGAIPSELMESEFFGAKRGAFTGAFADKSGYLDQAAGGTLFLDEIGELPLNLQVKLLRVIDQGTYHPVGSPEKRQADVRLVAATNRNLLSEVAAGRFREDLFYRLHVIPISMPPLRERKEDIPLLLEHFTSALAEDGIQPVFPQEVMRRLYAYDWPGNVREFINTVQRYMTLGVLDLIHTSRSGEGERPLQDDGQSAAFQEIIPLQQAVEDFERQAVEAAVKATQGNKSKAASLLGISRRHLYRKLNTETK